MGGHSAGKLFARHCGIAATDVFVLHSVPNVCGLRCWSEGRSVFRCTFGPSGSLNERGGLRSHDQNLSITAVRYGQVSCDCGPFRVFLTSLWKQEL